MTAVIMTAPLDRRAPASPPLADPQPAGWRRWWPAALILIAAIAVRCPQYGHLDLPGMQLDEQFYLLVGDRMLHGAVPVIDIWDRKPVGLFLLYAFARLFGGTVLPYQLLATAFAAATAIVIWRIARRSAGDAAGAVSGVAYLAWLDAFSGMGGQSPVFYNLFVAGAAWLACRANDRDDTRGLIGLGIAAAALGGIALQIKYTALPESVMLGGWCVWRLWRSGAGVSRVVATLLAMAVAGLAPTLAVAGFYAWRGAFPAFWYADILSIFDRGHLPPDLVRGAALYIAFRLAPLIVLLPSALLAAPHRDRPLLLGWIIAAVMGFVMVGNFYDHYTLPLLVPLTVAVAPLFRKGAIGIGIAALLVGWPLLEAGYPRTEPQGVVAALTRAAQPYLQGHCLFVYDGPAILYLTTHACLPSRIVYPDHFANAVETPALGLDLAAETARVLARRPGVIVSASGFVVPQVNRQTYAMVGAALARDYVRVATVRASNRLYYVDALRTLVRDPAAPPARMMAPLPHHTLTPEAFD